MSSAISVITHTAKFYSTISDKRDGKRGREPGVVGGDTRWTDTVNTLM